MTRHVPGAALVTGAIVWRGISRLDKVTPIVVVLTGLKQASKNSKTGNMVQSWVLVDRSRAVDAIRSGKDAAICGDCKHRGDGTGKGRTCYVALHTGLHWVSSKVRDGGYSELSLRDASELIAGRPIRLGTYGDPAAVPIRVWRSLVRHATTWTGYTHQWRKRPSLRVIMMASVDSPEEHAEAKALGWRTFRVRRVDEYGPEPLLRTEVMCPASIEAGHKTTCAHCSLCRGDRRARDIAIIDHSQSALAKRKRLEVIQ